MLFVLIYLLGRRDRRAAHVINKTAFCDDSDSYIMLIIIGSALFLAFAIRFYSANEVYPFWILAMEDTAEQARSEILRLGRVSTFWQSEDDSKRIQLYMNLNHHRMLF